MLGSGTAESFRQHKQLRVHAAAGTVGTSVLAVGALAMGWIPPLFNVEAIPVLGLLRTTSQGELLGRAAVLIGGALLLQSWLLLGTDVLSDQIARVRNLQRILLLWLIPTLLAPPLFSRDMYSYFVQGRQVALGLNPYTTGAASISGWFADGVDPMWGETPTPYGPLFLLVQREVTELARTPYWSAVLFRLVACVGIALMAYYVPKLAELQGINPAAALWLSVLNPLVLLHFAFGGHNDALMVGLMLAALHAAMKRRIVRTITLAAAAIAVKPIAIVIAPFAALLFLRRNTTLLQRFAAYAVAGVASILPVALMGMLLGVGVGWVQALTTPGSVRTWLSPATALGMSIGLLGNLFGKRDLDALAVTGSRMIFMLAAIVICAWLLWQPRGRTSIRSAALAFTVIIGLGPVVQPWYLLWALPLVATSGLHKSWHLKAVVLGTAGFVIYALAEPTATSDTHLDLFDSLGLLMAIAAVAAVLLASPRERALALGTQFAHGLQPRSADEHQRADAWVMR